MNRKICYTLALALLMGVLPAAMPQAPAEKSATEKSAAEKSTVEKSTAEKSTTERGFPSWAPQRSEMEPPVELQSIADKRITLKLADTSRSVYEAIGKQAGISVLFDPDYVARPVSVDLNGVSLEDALKTVALESATFWRPVTSSSIFIAADNPTKRREIEPQIIKSFYLPNISQAIDMQDLVNALRSILQIDRVQQLYSANTIIVRGTPDQLILTQKLINDISEAKKKAGEYRLEFKISELVNEKKLNSRNYVLVLEPHQIGKLRIGSRVPILAQEKDKQITYLDLGKNIDSQVTSESDHTVGLRMTVEFSDVAPGGSARGAGVGEQHHGDPDLKQMRMETSATLELAKPTVVGTLDDPVNNHTFQIEVTATRLDGFKDGQ
ncbi:MAG TPA: hypothetical protein VK699_00765 [Terriglobales bacterium]|jgi:hypothetical protein|nr:hypothetical protein [Terriglobales bacterium]